MGQSLIRKALIYKNFTLFQQILNSGCDVNLKFDGISILHLAIYYHGQLDIDMSFIAALIERGADVNIRSSLQGDTPVHWACLNADEYCLKYLIKKNANVFYENNFGQNPL